MDVLTFLLYVLFSMYSVEKKDNVYYWLPQGDICGLHRHILCGQTNGPEYNTLSFGEGNKNVTEQEEHSR